MTKYQGGVQLMRKFGFDSFSVDTVTVQDLRVSVT